MTCLCLTRNRRQWLPKAIQCYQTQTYPHRELLILSDGDDVRDLVPDEPGIRHVHLAGAATIGEKRNLGCEYARGEVIAHWDDDDYSAPHRLSDQIERLVASGKPVTGYHTLRFTDGREWRKYCGASNYALGTSLVYRKEWWMAHRFESIQVGEDNSFVATACKHAAITSADAGDLMHATVHTGNTSPKNWTGDSWKPCV